MNEPEMLPARRLPGVFKLAINCAIVFHLVALGALVLSAMSGPWAVQFLDVRSSQSMPPQFAAVVDAVTTRYYLEPLSMSNNYHFLSNYTDRPTVQLEVRVAHGKPMKFPDPSANAFVRFRQSALIRGLGADEPFQRASMMQGIPAAGERLRHTFISPSDTEAIKSKLEELKSRKYDSWAVPGKVTELGAGRIASMVGSMAGPIQPVTLELSPLVGDVEVTRKLFLRDLESVLYGDELYASQDRLLGLVKQPAFEFTEQMWATLPPIPLEKNTLNWDLYEEDEHAMPKMQVVRPSARAMILVRSFARHFEKQTGGKVAIVRLSRNPLAPSMMFPNPLERNKLQIDAPPPGYRLEIMSTNFNDGTPKRSWMPQ